MAFVDLALLSESKVAFMDHLGQVEIEFSEPEQLSPAEGRQLQMFLTRQELRLLACSGGTPLHRHVKVWGARDARETLPGYSLNNAWSTIEGYPGRLFYWGSAWDRGWYVGISLDQQVAVMVPKPLLAMRQRELLIASLSSDLAPTLADDPFYLASLLAHVEQQRKPENGQAIALVAEVENTVMSVATWLHIAGPEPTSYDRHDARGKEGVPHVAH